MRAFSKTEDQVENNAGQVLNAARGAANWIKADKSKFFSEVMILIPRDESRIDYDCGKTASALEEMLRMQPPDEDKFTSNISIHEVKHGDLFCGVLNYGVTKLLREGIDYVGIISSGASSYLTAENMNAIYQAFEGGAKAAGLAIEELQQSILEGRLANTFAFWDAIALMSVGGFDLRAQQPKKDDRTAPYLRGFGSDLYYPLAGVEEIIPLTRLVSTFGPCIAPIKPAGAAVWKAPNPATDPEGAARHQKKMGTKFERQAALAASVGADLSYLQYGVMEQYVPH